MSSFLNYRNFDFDIFAAAFCLPSDFITEGPLVVAILEEALRSEAEDRLPEIETALDRLADISPVLCVVRLPAYAARGVIETPPRVQIVGAAGEFYLPAPDWDELIAGGFVDERGKLIANRAASARSEAGFLSAKMAASAPSASRQTLPGDVDGMGHRDE